MEDLDDTETELWENAIAALLAKGSSHAEALEGANLLLTAHRRKRQEARAQGKEAPEAAAAQGRQRSKRR